MGAAAFALGGTLTVLHDALGKLELAHMLLPVGMPLAAHAFAALILRYAAIVEGTGTLRLRSLGKAKFHLPFGLKLTGQSATALTGCFTSHIWLGALWLRILLGSGRLRSGRLGCGCS